jgi:release factor glutamine methyltransferase
LLTIAGMSGPGEQWTVGRLLDWTGQYFARASLGEPRLAAEVLLAHVLGCGRVQLYARFDQAVADEHRGTYRQLVRRAAAGEPIAYLTGEKEFYSLAIAVTPEVMVPRPETELLVDAALAAAREAGGPARLWDVCTGSGCVAVAAATYAEQLAVLATDVSPQAVDVARANVRRHGLEGRVLVARADLLALPQAAREMAPFDAITANPPYVADEEMAALPPEVTREPPLALRAGPTGLEFIAPIIRDAPRHLRGGGTLAVEVGAGQAEAVYEILDRAGRYRNVGFLKDAAGIERTAVARVISDFGSGNSD